jgi:hypothetical protein
VGVPEGGTIAERSTPWRLVDFDLNHLVEQSVTDRSPIQMGRSRSRMEYGR